MERLYHMTICGSKLFSYYTNHLIVVSLYFSLDAIGEIIYEDDDKFDANIDNCEDDQEAANDPDYKDFCWCESGTAGANDLL